MNMTIDHITDVHAHYDEKVFDGDRKEVLESLREGGISLIINSGSELLSSGRSLELAHAYEFVYASVGVFPLEAVTSTGGGHPDWLSEIRRMAEDERTVAIGEIGLDYREIDREADRDIYRLRQRDVFIPQIRLANELGLPVVIHSCEADDDLMDILDAYPCRGMIHRYYCEQDCGRELMDRGFYIGIGPQITYPGSDRLTDIVRDMPPELMLLETDAPFLPNFPLKDRADSSMIEEVCVRIAALRGDMTPQEVADICRENASRLFGITL